MAGIYIHIPFCKQACHYCDFHFSTNSSKQHEMVCAIAKELQIQKDYLGHNIIETIYFGGGTPSLLSKEDLNIILGAVRQNYKVSDSPEICLEANPDDLSNEKFVELADAGVNRLSIGIQTFHDEHLAYLNRAHSSQEARACVDRARSSGINNISIDLIYAIPSSDHQIWEEDLAQAMALKPDHISSYCLTIENKTAFGNWLSKGKIKPINEEFAAQQFEILIETMYDNGYEQYEVSNFCLPNQYSKHNSNYWKQQQYLGVGPSAHSYNGVHRQFNISHNQKYLSTMALGEIPYTLDILNDKDHINEYLLTSLRTKWGADMTFLKTKHGYDLLHDQEEYLEELRGKELAIIQNDTLYLTNRGKLFADKIASDLFLV